LPEIGKSPGKTLADFKKASNELKQTWEDKVRLDKDKESMPEILNSTDPKKDLMKDTEQN
jgi:Sec-independent protein translocase protein TatA